MTDLQQRTPAWHVARRGKLTASNLGAALGQVSYTSRSEAFRRATGQERFQGNDATRWGTDNEANGVMAYQALTGNVVQATGLHVHPSNTWIAGSPDGFVGLDGMIEVKCPFYFRKNGGGRLHKTIPTHYLMQVNALLEITGRQWCDYVCWAPEGMAVYRVERDPQLFDFLLTYYAQFYAAVQAQATDAPPLPTVEKLKITHELEDAAKRCVNYTFWDRANPCDPVPYSDPLDEEDDGDETRDHCGKRQRVPEMQRPDLTPYNDEGASGEGEVAS